MEITSVSTEKSVSENESCSSQSLKDLHCCVYGSFEASGATDLGDHLTELLNIKEDHESSDEIQPMFYQDDGSEYTHYSHSHNLAAENHLIKIAACTSSSKSSSTSESINRKEELNVDVTVDTGVFNGDECSAEQLNSHSTSLPAPLNLTSAMKGSREKLGMPPKKLGVKWAPDVYDPVPTSVSHVPKNKPRYRSYNNDKRKGKSKQKNRTKSSRGNDKGKDKKKRIRKHGSSSDSKLDFHSLEETSASVVSSSELQTSVVDFDIGSPVPFCCASSFLRKSSPKLHMAVGEAT